MNKGMRAALVAAVVLVAVPSQAEVTGTPRTRSAQGIPPTDITFEPASAAHPTCPAFGACPPGSQITTQYLAFGVDFTVFGGHPPVGVFTDPPDKFGGVNAGGNLDLLTPTCGRIVLVGTSTQGRTNFIATAAGFSGGPQDLLLEAYNNAGALIGSSLADDGVDADGDLIAEVPDPSGQIASFCLSTPTGDAHGVHFVYLNTPVVVPVELQTFEVE
jgi:hypothetical protein